MVLKYSQYDQMYKVLTSTFIKWSKYLHQSAQSTRTQLHKNEHPTTQSTHKVLTSDSRYTTYLHPTNQSTCIQQKVLISNHTQYLHPSAQSTCTQQHKVLASNYQSKVLTSNYTKYSHPTNYINYLHPTTHSTCIHIHKVLASNYPTYLHPTTHSTCIQLHKVISSNYTKYHGTHIELSEDLLDVSEAPLSNVHVFLIRPFLIQGLWSVLKELCEWEFILHFLHAPFLDQH